MTFASNSAIAALRPVRAALAALFLLGSAVPMLAADPTQAQIDLGRQLAESSGATRSFDGVVNTVIEQTVRTIGQTRPEIKQQVTDIITAIRPEIDKQKAEMTDVAAKIFASDLSEAELKDCVTFFTSPSGKKYVASQPNMLAKLVTVMQAWQQNLGAALVNRLRIELKKQNIDL